MFSLTLNRQERTEQLRLLEESLWKSPWGGTHVEVHHTHTLGYRKTVLEEEAVVRGLLEKVPNLST